jgi:uncharacterized membrane protein YqjE
MATDLVSNPANPSGEPSTTALVSGIARDAHELLTQQLTLLKVEAEEDLRLTTRAAIAFGLGLALGIVGILLLTLGLVHVLEQFTPGYAWFWYLVVGAIVAIVASILLVGALHAFSKINPPLAESQEAMKETLEWQTRPN